MLTSMRKYEKIEIANQLLDGENYSNQRLSKFVAVESSFTNCSFENMKINDVCFGGGINQTKYIGCSFDNSSFSSNVVGVARFEKCSFRNVKIKKMFCLEVDFIECVFSGEMKQGNFLGAFTPLGGVSTTNEIINNDFAEMNIGDVGFVDIDLRLQKFPKLDRLVKVLNISDFLVESKKKANTLVGNGLKDDVLKVIQILELISEGGNNQMLVDKSLFPKNLLNAVNMIFELYQQP